MDTHNSVLGRAIRQCGAIAATVHERRGNALILKEQIGIPTQTIALIRSIPKGKGMAGQAWETGQPVFTCNLKSDARPVIRPGARAVQGVSATAIPVYADTGDVSHVVGFSFADERSVDGESGRKLYTLARSVAAALSGDS